MLTGKVTHQVLTSCVPCKSLFHSSLLINVSLLKLLQKQLMYSGFKTNYKVEDDLLLYEERFSSTTFLNLTMSLCSSISLCENVCIRQRISICT